MRSCYAVHVVRSVVTPETWKLHHLGIPVPDLDQAIEDYQTLGNATFQPEFLIDSAQMQEYLVYGKVLGCISARLQTWFPFAIQICLNGREWLARQLDNHGVRYERLDNCLLEVADWQQAPAPAGSAGGVCVAPGAEAHRRPHPSDLPGGVWRLSGGVLLDGVSDDKHGRSLRVETTINDPSPFKILRAVQGNPDGPRSQRPMRRGISDLASRAQLSQAANERYLEALASLDVQHPLQHLIDPVCRPTVWQRRRERVPPT